MGLFSFITTDTRESLPCVGAENRKTFPVFLKDNKGNVWESKKYQGYGVFGGKDIFVLIAEMNGLKTRKEGHSLYYGNTKFLAPNLVEDEDTEWVDEDLDECPNQGYFY